MVKSLSVFFPTYNEEKNIGKAIEAALIALKSLKLDKFEIIVINDGSKDNTAKVVTDWIKKDKRIRMITHNPNKGYGEAIKSGLYSAKYDWIFFTDSDVQFDISEINKLLPLTDKAQLVVGYRIDRKDPFMRKLNGWGWTTLNNLVFGLGVKDVDCAFKLIKREVIETIQTLESTRGAMISPELLARAKKAGFVIKEVGVSHYPRLEGNPTGANLKVIVASFKDLFKLWWKIK